MAVQPSYGNNPEHPEVPPPCACVCFAHWCTLFLACAGVVSRPWTLCSAFGVDYLFSLALALRAVSPPLVLTISAWGLRECGYLASRVGSYIKGSIHTIALVI